MVRICDYDDRPLDLGNPEQITKSKPTKKWSCFQYTELQMITLLTSLYCMLLCDIMIVQAIVGGTQCHPCRCDVMKYTTVG